MGFEHHKFFPPELRRVCGATPFLCFHSKEIHVMSNKTEFEYRSDENAQTPFEIFLRYTDEKEKSAVALGKILSSLNVRPGMTFLDIGSGNGEYIRLALNNVPNLKETAITLLEPSADLAKRLRHTVQLFPSSTNTKIVNSSFDDFSGTERFDIVLASHVPLVKDNLKRLPVIYERILELLKPHGSLVVVLRGKDDIHQFRTRFKTKIMGRDYCSLTIDDAEVVFRRFTERLSLRIKKFNVKAKLHLPYPDDMRDVISVVEFLLNTNWGDIPTKFRQSILAYIRNRSGLLRQVDSLLVVKKIHRRKKY